MLTKRVKNMTINQLVRTARFAPNIAGPIACAELTRRLGFEISEADIPVLMLAIEAFEEAHNQNKPP